MSISVLILTLNEENILPACLEAVRWSDDIVVFDSFSSDRTVEIASALGARVFQRRFDNERDHRTASLLVDFKYPWVFNPDADEIATPSLSQEMLKAVAKNGPEVAYRLRRKDMFMGKWMRHCSLYPTWFVRLFQPRALTFERSINLHYVVQGPEGLLAGHMIHHSFTKGLGDWFAKHNRYSSLEAREMLASIGQPRSFMSDLLNRNPVVRRKAIKELSFRLPCRSALRFLYTYLLRRGFLDGREGYTYCRLVAFYEYMITLKAQELRENNAAFCKRA